MKTEQHVIKSGQEFQFAYPYFREEVELFDGEGMAKMMSWRPGVRYVNVYPDDSKAVADGIGKQIITVISIHKPGRFPERVFFTRKWLSPDGRLFGKPKLHAKTAQVFRRLIQGYRYDYELIDAVAVI